MFDLLLKLCKQSLKKKDQFNKKNFTLATVNTINEKCVPGAAQSNNFQNQKSRVPGLPGTGQSLLSW